MTYRAKFLLFLLFCICQNLIPVLQPMEGREATVSRKQLQHSQQRYGLELRKFVEEDSGLVHYRLWQNDQGGLRDFVSALSRFDPAVYKTMDREEKLAFWLNAYNALAIKSVLDHYPVKANVDYYPSDSIRQFNDGWEELKFEVMGQSITLYDIEHDRLRTFCDPRIHFAVASASMDSAYIGKTPFVGAGLDQRLDQLAHKFFQRPAAFSFDVNQGNVWVSRLFLWFTLDFAAKAGYAKATFPPPKDEDIILSYIALYLPSKTAQDLSQARQNEKLHFDYLPYNWALNDADRK